MWLRPALKGPFGSGGTLIQLPVPLPGRKGPAIRNMDASLDTQTYRFRDFELDLGAHQLRSGGEPVRIERLPFELLVLLVTRQGKLVQREEIIGLIWPGKVVIDFDSGLNTIVRKVRQALGDSPDDPVFIETVPGLGYRFISAVEVAASLDPVIGLPPAARGLRSRSAAILSLLLLAAIGTAYVWQSNSVVSGQTRIAVLPFENLTGDDELSYLASGIAEETSTSLAQIDLPNLSVIGIVSATAFAGSAVPLQQIGHDLNVDFVVLSSLRLDKSRIRVTSRLIRIADSEQIWSASFDRELTNVLGLQRELSIAIAEQIRQRLSPEVAAAIDRRQTQNPEAYKLYLKGRYEWARFQPNSVSRALEYYQQAVATDPSYALAWAGIARDLSASIVTAEKNREAIRSASLDALQRALEFGSDLAETQLALGSFHFFVDQDFPQSELAARKSLALDPNSAMSHMFLGMVLSQREKYVEARAMLRRARELDPLFPLMFANSAVVALAAGEPQEALEFATQAIAINPEFWVGYLHLGSAWLALGEYDASIRAYSDAERLSGDNSARATSARAYVIAKLGRKDEAHDVLAELISRSEDRFVPPYYIAVVYAGLDDVDSAFEWLLRAVENDNFSCSSLANDSRLETLRTDLRFESLMTQCGLVP